MARIHLTTASRGSFKWRAQNTTARYPQSRLVATPTDLNATVRQNALYNDSVNDATLLNCSAWTWLTQKTYVNNDNAGIDAGIARKSITRLDAPYYTVFFNATSAAEWNSRRDPKDSVLVPLETPHNDIHLSVGGFEVPGFNANAIDGAQADMGEVCSLNPPPNQNKSLIPADRHRLLRPNLLLPPLLDRQRLLAMATQTQPHASNPNNPLPPRRLTRQYSVDSQGPTSGIPDGSWVILATLLEPFKKPDNTCYTSLDVVDIEHQLKYTYDNALPGAPPLPAPGQQRDFHPRLRLRPRQQPLQAGHARLVRGRCFRDHPRREGWQRTALRPRDYPQPLAHRRLQQSPVTHGRKAVHPAARRDARACGSGAGCLGRGVYEGWGRELRVKVGSEGGDS